MAYILSTATIRKWAIIYGSIVLFGALGMIAFVSHYKYEQLSLRAGVEFRITQNLQRSLWRYGIVRAVDTSERTVTIDLKNKYVEDGPVIPTLLHLVPGTAIAHQEIERSGGVGVALSASTPGTFEDLVPGAHVATVFYQDIGSNQLIASFILFGDPL